MSVDGVGGIWTYAVELCRALQKLGFHINLAYTGPTLTPWQREQLAHLPLVQLHEKTFGPEITDHETEEAGEWLLSLAHRTASELVHLNGYTYAHLPWHVPTVVVAHSCVCSWWEAVKGEEIEGEVWKQHRRNVRKKLNAVDRIVTPTQAMLDTLRHYYGDLPKAQVIPTACLGDPFYQRPKEEFLFCAAPRSNEAKNVMALERIASRLSWPVHLASDPDADRGRRVNVVYEGEMPREELAERLSRAAIYALPAFYEPFGFTILEAALSQCALVVGDLPTLRELWGEAALYVDPYDDDAIAATLQQLIDNPKRCREMGHRAWIRALDFSPSHMATQYFHLYQSMLEEHLVEE